MYRACTGYRLRASQGRNISMQFEKNELIDAVKELIGVMKDSGLDYISVKNDKFEVELGQKNPPPRPIPPMTMPLPAGFAPAGAPAPSPVQGEPAPAPATANTKSITSPIVGTFYSAPSPTKPPFVKVGDKVNEGDVVCIVESMKVMNEIQADVSGVVKEIAASDGEAVEFGQPLIILE